MNTPKITYTLLCLIALTPNNITCSSNKEEISPVETPEEQIYKLENKVLLLEQNYSEKENEFQMQIRVLRTQIKKQKLRYNKVMEDEIKKTKNEYQEIINEKNKSIQTLEEKEKELNNKNERLQIKNDRLEIQQKASDYNEIRKSLSERLSRTIWQMNETEDKDDKELLQMRTQFKDLKKQSRFFKKISNTVIKYNEQLKKQTQDDDFYFLIRQDVDKTYEAYNNPQNQNNSSEDLEKKDIEINKLKKKEENQQHALESMSETLAILENEINELKEELENKKKVIASDKDYVEYAEQELLLKCQNLDEKKIEVKKLTVEAQIQNNKITILENKINELKEELEKKKTDINKSENNEYDQERQIKDLLLKKHKLGEELNEKDQTIENLNNEITLKNQTLEKLEKKEDDQQHMIKGLQVDNLDLREELEKKNGLDKPTDEVSRKMQVLTHRNQTLQDELDKKNQSIQDLKKEVSTLSQAGKNRDSQGASSNEKGNTLVFGGIGLVIGVTVTLIFTKMYKKSNQQAIKQ